MNKYYRWFRRVLLLTVIMDIVLGGMTILFPNSTLRFLGQDPSHDVMWTAFGGMCLVMIGLLMYPATRDPLRYRLTANYAVTTRAAFALFFLLLWPGRYLFFGILDLVLFIALLLLLWAARRVPQPEWVPAAASTAS